MDRKHNRELADGASQQQMSMNSPLSLQMRKQVVSAVHSRYECQASVFFTLIWVVPREKALVPFAGTELFLFSRSRRSEQPFR